MAAISHVFTIRRAAQILGRDEDLLWELSDQLEPEDGKLWVCDIDGAETPRLHPRWHRGSSRNYQGSDRSRRLISRRVYRGAQRMLTFWRCWSAHDPASERRAGMASDRSHRYEEGLCEFVVAGAGGAAPRSAVRTSVLLSWAPRRSVEGDLA